MELNLSGEDKEDKEDSLGRKAVLGKKLYPKAATGAAVLGEVTNKYGRGSSDRVMGKQAKVERPVVVEEEQVVGEGESEVVMVRGDLGEVGGGGGGN